MRDAPKSPHRGFLITRCNAQNYYSRARINIKIRIIVILQTEKRGSP